MEVSRCITKELLEKALQKHLGNKDVAVLNYTCSSVVPSGDNYNSNLVRSSIVYSTRKNGDKSTVLILVKSSLETANGEDFETTNDMKFFDREIEMYTKILPELQKCLDNSGLGTLSAKCIHVEREPVLIIAMEDLSLLGFRMLDRRQGLDLKHCKAAIQKLAQLHAASIVIYEKKPQAFLNFHQALFPGNSSVLRWIKVGLKEVIKTCANRSDMQRYVEKLTKVENKIRKKCEAATAVKAESLNVLNHGDFWTNNIMFKYDLQGNIEDLRIVDYQIGVFTSPAIDLHYFWATTPNIEVRKQHLDTILNYYCDELTTTLTKLGYTAEKLPTKKCIRNDFFSRIFYGFATSLTVLPLSKCSSRNDANVNELLDPLKCGENSFRHQAYNSSLYWKHLEYVLPFVDNWGMFE